MGALVLATAHLMRAAEGGRARRRGETLVLRLKAFDKLREKVAIEHARKEFFFNKLASVEQLCELMPYSAMSDTCKGILTMESQSQAQQKEDVAPEQVN